MKYEIEVNEDSAIQIVRTVLMEEYDMMNDPFFSHREDIEYNKKIKKSIRKLLRHFSSTDEFEDWQKGENAKIY
tara:strand:+ start:2429 stop:2650 length:222 start_codon:yes stop_codon:yes gene_type:complete